MASFERVSFATVHIIVMTLFLKRTTCDDICPNGITNITGQVSGEIKYPKSGVYGVNETKCWRIEIPDPYIGVGITFQRFEIEECQSCACDSLAVSPYYNNLKIAGTCGRFSPSRLEYLNRLSGEPPYLTASSKNVYILLKTDDSGHYSGFQLSFIAESEAFYHNVSTREAGLTVALLVLGSMPFSAGSQTFLNVSHGEISTPKYGTKNYPENFAWQWFLLAPEGHQVKISFEAFELEQSENCQNDYLEVREAYSAGSSNPWAIGGEYGAILARPKCGTTKPGDIQSAGNMVWVHFRSDSSTTTTYKGFKASFTTSGQGSLSNSNVSTLLFVSSLLMFTSFLG